jgi:uncharacterized protein (DUF1330 family)
MSVFVVSEVEVLDDAAAERYRELAGASIESHGGAYVVRGAAPEALEGEWPGSRRLVIVEFPSEEDARAWYSSPEYAEALAIRRAALERRLLLADGIPRESTGRELLGRFHRAMLDLSSDDLADLHAPDAVYEFPLLSPARPDRYEGREAIRQGFREAWESAPGEGGGDRGRGRARDPRTGGDRRRADGQGDRDPDREAVLAPLPRRPSPPRGHDHARARLRRRAARAQALGRLPELVARLG